MILFLTRYGMLRTNQPDEKTSIAHATIVLPAIVTYIEHEALALRFHPGLLASKRGVPCFTVLTTIRWDVLTIQFKYFHQFRATPWLLKKSEHYAGIYFHSYFVWYIIPNMDYWLHYFMWDATIKHTKVEQRLNLTVWNFSRVWIVPSSHLSHGCHYLAMHYTQYVFSLSLLGKEAPEGWFNIKISSYQYRKSHCGDKTVVRSSYLHNGISYTGKMTSLYWIRALDICLRAYLVLLLNCPFCFMSKA